MSALLIQYLVKDYTRMGRRLVPEFRFMLEDPIEDKLPKVAVPSMVVRGEKDPKLRSAGLTRRTPASPGSRCCDPKLGARRTVQRPNATDRCVRPFLSQGLE
jgi:2-hydroxy-6-oxonona-2,4-dienedioate hydrolase